MKTNKYFFSAMGFLTGTLFGISIILFLSFSNAPSGAAPAAQNGAISTTVAHDYFNGYLLGAVPYTQVIKGFTIDKSQLTAMNSILGENSALTGFRIYFGKDNSGNKVGIVVGVDNSGRDAVKNSIYGTSAANLSPCPPICDVASPITLGN